MKVIMYTYTGQEIQAHEMSVRNVTEFRKYFREYKFQVLGLFLVALEPQLKGFQTDEAMEKRAARKADKKLCRELEEIGKYKSEYKKRLELHKKAFGITNPYFPFAPFVPFYY